MTVAPDQHQLVAELLGAFALHAVDPDEAEMVERHLAECPRCQIEVDQLRAVAAAMGNSSEPPSVALWDRIAAQLAVPVGASRQADVPTASLRATGGGHLLEMPRAGIPNEPAQRPHRRSVPPAGSKSHRRAWTTVAVGAAAACAALAAVFGIKWSDANSRVNELQNALVHHGTRAAVDAALESPGRRVVDLRSSDGVQVAELVVRRDAGGFVVSSRMRALPVEETYQLWAEIGHRAISLGLLGARLGEGDAFSVGSSVGHVTEVMVTVEPSGGVVSPGSAPVASGALS